MKAEEIQTADDLEAWLNGLPEEQALQVAPLIVARAALRLFPVWAECCAHLNGKESEDSRGPHFFNGLRCYIFMLVLSQPRANGERVYDFSTPLMKIAFRLPEDFSKYPVLAAITGKVAFEAAACALRENTTSRAVRATQDALGCTESVLLSYSLSAPIFSIKDDNCNPLSVIVSDAISFEEGQEFLHLPLWPIGEDPLATIWAEAAPLFDRHRAWSVFKDLYENALHARPQNWPLLTELAQKDEAFWTGTDTEVLDRIAGVMEGFAISRAIPFDYTFDQIARMMRIVGIGDDAAHLRDPKANRRFLDDAEEARDRLQDFVDYTANMGGGSNTAGVTRIAAVKLLDELRRIEDLNHLRVRLLMERAKSLEMFMGDPQHAGDLSASLITILADAVTGLRGVFRTHFGPAFAALAPLSQLSWDQLDRDAVLSLFDQKIHEIRTISSEQVPLDSEGQAILADMLRELFEWRARVFQASDDQMREIFDQRFAEATGATGLALLRFWQKRAPQIGKLADGTVKIGNAANALGDIVESVTNLSN
ncbi:MAG: hypothetical protein GJ679_05640 [Rhodobacteraceae bacterium]|jgi:hypothetical protein|nr:hypothetical protein [Paracoccaceae bacterium]QPI85463.1 hypothetical protein I3V23_00065 [Rhodobacterales bacterium HKCCA1288]